MASEAPRVITREEWLLSAVEKLAPMVEAAAREVAPEHALKAGIPTVQISMGFPSGGMRSSTLAECWQTTASKKGYSIIFIHPRISNTVEILGAIVHELVHAVLDCQHGHSTPYRRIALAVGLKGPMKSASPGGDLTAHLRLIADDLGKFPGAGMKEIAPDRKTQGTRMLKLECPVDGYVVRTTQKWLDVGLPSCPCGQEMEAPHDE
jgi:hypothetical protein